MNPNILDQKQVAALMGYKCVGAAERKLRDQGITPFYGRPGYWFITLQQLNAAKGIGTADHDQANEELL